jgi:hypothetical protein
MISIKHYLEEAQVESDAHSEPEAQPLLAVQMKPGIDSEPKAQPQSTISARK